MNAGISFDDLIQPLNRSRFLQDFFDQKYFHNQGLNDRFEPLLTTSHFMDFLKILPLWNEANLRLYHQGAALSPHLYSKSTLTLNQETTLKPDFDRIQSYLATGATLVANDVGTLTPGLREVVANLAETFEAPVQANLYYSIKAHPGFLSHFDVHDVFVFHLEGEKKWRLYEGKVPSPINHPLFNQITQEQHDHQKGPLLKEILLKPGSFLYLPRGMYHDALAVTDHSLHISFGVTRPIGLKAITLLFEAMVYETIARQNLPFTKESQELNQHLKDLGECAVNILNSSHFQEQLKAHLLSDYKN